MKLDNIFVRHDAAQSLTDAEKEQVRENIGATLPYLYNLYVASGLSIPGGPFAVIEGTSGYTWEIVTETGGSVLFLGGTQDVVASPLDATTWVLALGITGTVAVSEVTKRDGAFVGEICRNGAPPSITWDRWNGLAWENIDLTPDDVVQAVEEMDDTQKAAVRTGLGLETMINVSDYGAVGNNSADDTAALQAAFAAAKAAKTGLVFGPGKIYRHTSALVIDWDCTIDGNYAILKPQTAGQVGIMLGNSATGPHMIEINNLNIEGTGSANGQILIDTPETGTKMVTLRNCKVWFGGTGMRCNLMDYLRVERCWFKGSLTNVDLANDVRSAVFTGGGFGDATGNPVTPTTQTHVLCQEVYGVTFIGVEWGDGVTGIKVQNSTSKTNQFITLLGCRMERVRGNFIIPSDDTTGGKYSPTNLLVEQCEFMGYGSAWTNNAAIHIPGGGGPFVFRNCTVSQSAASQFMIYAQSANAFVMIENCVMAGSSTTVYKNSAGTTSSAARIVEGKNDATIKIPSPFGATHRLGTITATTSGINLGQLPRSCKILGMYITVKTALVSSATDYWTFALKTYSNGSGPVALTTYSQQNVAVPAYGRRGTTTITTPERENGDYVYVLDITKNGAAANLDDLAVIIVYEQF